MARTKILVVEDERLLSEEIRRMLGSLGYEVAGIASSGEEAIGKAAETCPDLVLMDIVLKGSVDGVKAAEHISKRLDIPVVYLSAHADEATLHRAKITEAYGYILKPFEERDLHTSIEIALYKHRMEKTLREKERLLHAALEKAKGEKAKSEAIIAAIGDGISIQDTDYRILYQNEIHKGLGGDHLGEYCYKAYACRDHICEGCPVAMSFKDGKIHIVERSNPSGALLVEITASPVRDATGKIIAGIELATNARDAMPGGGFLTIDIARITLNHDFVLSHGYGTPGTYAEISVSDSGIGMDIKTRERIFEPFFTTKESGKGTGLGLAMVYGIVRQHGGYINVYSEPGKGTTFKILLPLIKTEEESKPAVSPPVRHGTETILIAEDDVSVRKLTREVLEKAGYKVIVAEDGEDAVHKFIENKDAIRLLVFDVIMPKKNGQEAFREIRKVKPDMKVIFLSGYTTDLLHKDWIMEEGMTFLPKPISPNELARKVRDVLDS